MEGDKVYKSSYDNVERLVKDNLTDKVTIDYSKLDAQTASEVRLAISRALGKRKREIYAVLMSAR